MFVEAVQNNGKTYLRLVESVRIRNKDGYKVSSKKVIMNIGPLSRFNDGQPDYVERLKKPFKAGNPLIPSLLPYCSENKAVETYRLSINEGSPDCFGHPKMFCQVLLEKILEELGLNTFFASYPNRCHAASQAWLFYYQKRSDFYSQQVLIHRLGGRFLMYQADMKTSENPWQISQ